MHPQAVVPGPGGVRDNGMQPAAGGARRRSRPDRGTMAADIGTSSMTLTAPPGRPRLRRRHRAAVPAALILSLALAAAGVTAAAPAHAQPAPSPSLDAGIERYRAALVADLEGALTSAQTLRERAAAGDAGAARRAWLDARVGWERSEVFTAPFVPELDRAIDAWPDGAAGFHAVEARLFGTGRTDFAPEAERLVRDLAELKDRAATMALTSQGVLEGVVRLTYEVGESKADGGESRVSGSSLQDMRNNVGGIDLAWGTVFAAAVAARDAGLGDEVRRGIDGLAAVVAVRDLRAVDQERLRSATEELVLRLQAAAPLLALKRPALEADAR